MINLHDLFYTYKIYDPVENKEYIGSRTKRGIKDPYSDVYMGSVKSKKWKNKWKEITARSKKQILAVFFTPQEALQHEIILHNFYDVGNNPAFFNEAKQTSSGFSTSGKPSSRKGIIVSDETKAKLRKPRKPLSEEHKAKLRVPTGPRSEETKAKQRRPKSEEHKTKLRGPRAPMSEEQKELRRKPKSEEHKEKLRAPKSDEHKAKISATKKRKFLEQQLLKNKSD